MVESAANDEERGGKTLHNIAWNYSGHIFKLAINFGLTFLIVRRLSVTEYGIFLLISSLSSSLYLLDLGLSSILVQAYVAASLNRDKRLLNELIATVIVAAASLGSLGAVVLIALSFMLPGPINIPPEYIRETSLVLIASGGTFLFGFLDTAFEPLYQSANRFDRINQIQLAGTVLILIATVVLLHLGYGIVALAVIQSAAAALQLLLSIVFFRSTLPDAAIDLTCFHWCVLKPLLNLSKWAFLNNISAYLLEIFIWTILGTFGSMRDAALFGLAAKIPKQLWSLVDRGAGVCLPLLSKYAMSGEPGELRQIYLKAQRFILGASLPFVVLGIVFARPLIHVWAGAAYTPAATVLQWLLLAFLGHALLYVSDLLLYASGHIRKAAVISAAGGLITLAVALALVHRFGAAGMSFSMALIQVAFICTLFTLEACKFARIPLGTFLRETVAGLGLPATILMCGLGPVLVFWRYFSSGWLVLLGILLGTAYFAIWGFRTALPLYHDSLEPSN